MKTLYKKITNSIFKEEDMKKALEFLKELMNKMNVDLTYYFYNTKTTDEFFSDSDLKKETLELKERFEKKETKEGSVLKYHLDELVVIFQLKKLKEENYKLVKDELDYFVTMMQKSSELEVYRAHSFINPLFYEVAKIFYVETNILEEALEDLDTLILGILGVKLVKLSKNHKIHFFKKEFYDELIKFKHNDFSIQYAIEREIGNILERDKILNTVFFIINNYLDFKQLERKQQEFLEYQISSKKNLENLNKLLEKSLYKMTFISNLYSKLSKTRDVKKSIVIVKDIILSEITYEYIRIECNNIVLEEGIKVEDMEEKILEEKIDFGEVNYKINFVKDEINNEDEVYLQLIYNHSKIELENILLHKKLEEIAITDNLTKIYNHRYFVESMENRILEVERHGGKLSLLMFDVDNFKFYNDNYGHQAGDGILEKIGVILKETLRRIDIPCRYGGEEFIVILPYTDEEASYNIGERIRIRIKEEMKITVSVGVTEYKVKDSLKTILKRVDTALYKAKKSGKDQVTRM